MARNDNPMTPRPEAEPISASSKAPECFVFNGKVGKATVTFIIQGPITIGLQLELRKLIDSLPIA